MPSAKKPLSPFTPKLSSEPDFTKKLRGRKPQVAIYYDNRFGRNDGPPLYYYNVLKNQLKLDTVHLIPEGDTRRYGKFDLHFWVDWGEDGLPVDHDWMPPQDGGKTIYVVSDAHIDDGGKKYRFERARKFDYVFFNQKRAVEEYPDSTECEVAKDLPDEGYALYGKDGKKLQEVRWLPHAAEPTAYPATTQVKKYDVCFIGHVQERENFNGMTRVDALDRLFKEFPNSYFGTRNPQKPEMNMFEDAARKFAKSKIVFNISIGDDLNMRLFEILSSGAFQLTNWLPTLEELGLKEGVHLATYRTYDEMIEKAHYYLGYDTTNPSQYSQRVQECEKIAAAGHQWFQEHGTYKHRVLTILKTVGYPETGGDDK